MENNVEVQKREIRYILSTLQDYHAKKKRQIFTTSDFLN